MLWLLVSGSISSGLVPGVEASEQPMRMQGSRVGPQTGRPPPPGPGPQLPARLPGGPCPDPPHHKLLGVHFPGRELLSLLLALDPTQAGRASVSPQWGHPQRPGPRVS